MTVTLTIGIKRIVYSLTEVTPAQLTCFRSASLLKGQCTVSFILPCTGRQISPMKLIQLFSLSLHFDIDEILTQALSCVKPSVSKNVFKIVPNKDIKCFRQSDMRISVQMQTICV